MYKCMECGHLFEEGEQKTWKEDRGEYWGSPCCEEMSGCPICEHPYEEAKRCLYCGEWFRKAELSGGAICHECLQQIARNFDLCYGIADCEKENIKLNSLITFFFSAEEIESYILPALRLRLADFGDFVERDEDWFAAAAEQFFKGDKSQ